MKSVSAGRRLDCGRLRSSELLFQADYRVYTCGAFAFRRYCVEQQVSDITVDICADFRACVMENIRLTGLKPAAQHVLAERS